MEGNMNDTEICDKTDTCPALDHDRAAISELRSKLAGLRKERDEHKEAARVAAEMYAMAKRERDKMVTVEDVRAFCIEKGYRDFTPMIEFWNVIGELKAWRTRQQSTPAQVDSEDGGGE